MLCDNFKLMFFLILTSIFNYGASLFAAYWFYWSCLLNWIGCVACNVKFIIEKWEKCHWERLLIAFAKLISETINFVMSECPSVRMEQLGSHLANFYEILYLSILGKYIKRTEDSLKYDKTKGEFTWRPIHIFDNISLTSSKNEKSFRQKL